MHSEIPSRFDNRDRIVSFNFYFSIELRLEKIHGRKVKKGEREKEKNEIKRIVKANIRFKGPCYCENSFVTCH